MDYRSPDLEKATRSRIELLDTAWQERQQAGEGGREGGVGQAAAEAAAAAAAVETNGGEVDKGRWKEGGREGGKEGGKRGARGISYRVM